MSRPPQSSWLVWPQEPIGVDLNTFITKHDSLLRQQEYELGFRRREFLLIDISIRHITILAITGVKLT